ncbi:MAG: ATP-grasp domain-containing protein [Oligoflexia bacterium]|nr:ATP-grasp domain-containing protein [Oligoflexia bacterium]
MPRKIKKIAIANRGEIAVRLISTCQEMGITPILLYSSADQNSKAFRMCSEKVCIGPEEAKKSYLNTLAIIEGALSAGADAIHPGYGFLSEKAELAKACNKNNLIFIGPPENCLEIFGDKVLARKQAIKCGIPVLPAYTMPEPAIKESSDSLLMEAGKIGFPIMIKSTKGGGGRGLRIVRSQEEWSEAFSSAKREIKAAFGSSEVFIEKYLPFARHIEVQVFVDASGQVFHLFDRDCSIQRKQQKIIEEAPALLPQFVQKEMQSAAVELLQSVRYLQAGTVEFLYHDSQFYFMEVNPRIQVECPVTEMILGIDLIRAQVLTAQGLSPFIQKKFIPRGHSIQCRIYAEDMQKQVPDFGPLGTCEFPQGVNRRFDMGYESEDQVPGFYDAMLGKCIVWEESRLRAIEKMKKALSDILIFGLKTNLSFLQDLISHTAFREGKTHTRFVEEMFLPFWKEKEIHALPPEVIFTLLKTFSAQTKFVSFHKKEKHFNPWAYFSK